MVGVAPRLIARDPDDRDGWRYLRWWHVWWNGAFSLVLTKAAVLDAGYLAAYGAPQLAAARAHVDAHRNCEDLLMAFVVANATRARVRAVSPLPPVARARAAGARRRRPRNAGRPSGSARPTPTTASRS